MARAIFSFKDLGHCLEYGCKPHCPTTEDRMVMIFDQQTKPLTKTLPSLKFTVHTHDARGNYLYTETYIYDRESDSLCFLSKHGKGMLQGEVSPVANALETRLAG